MKIKLNHYGRRGTAAESKIRNWCAVDVSRRPVILFHLLDDNTSRMESNSATRVPKHEETTHFARRTSRTPLVEHYTPPWSVESPSDTLSRGSLGAGESIACTTISPPKPQERVALATELGNYSCHARLSAHDHLNSSARTAVLFSVD